MKNEESTTNEAIGQVKKLSDKYNTMKYLHDVANLKTKKKLMTKIKFVSGLTGKNVDIQKLVKQHFLKQFKQSPPTLN